MSVIARIIAVALLLLGRCEVSTTDTPPWPGNARYSVSGTTLNSALECGTPIDGGGRAEPVLLVHGTGVTPEQNWGWSYRPALRKAGFEVCWVTLPNAAFEDIQISAEYAARAIEIMNHRAGELVDVIGHSQGGLSLRWAIKWFPAGALVDDYVGFASPNHGTRTAISAARAGKCFAACWQMRPRSAFIGALNRGDETPGDVSYTSIYTINDEAVRPAESSSLAGAMNVVIQDVCPGRPVEHLLLAGDAVTWELAVDALTHRGAADVERVSPFACFKLALPGATLNWPERGADTVNVRYPSREPPLRPYAR
ncbi:MAG: lipase [Actinomycetota bacterium]|nr:lipase [Actinomycetota bacterium]